MELHIYPIATFREQCRACQIRLSKPIPNHKSLRATYEEVRFYYIQYVKRNRLSNYFRSGCEVTSVQRVYIDASFYDDLIDEIRAPESLWGICGYDTQNKNSFMIHAEYIFLAIGIPQEVTRSLGIIGEQASQSLYKVMSN